MDNRLNKQALLDVLEQLNRFFGRKVHLIACGGTALTLMDIKPSTKDIDFIIPIVSEYRYLIRIIKNLGYRQITGSGWQRRGDQFIFDLFIGKRIHTTELLESPLEARNHTLFKEFSHLYIGILNPYDLIASKLFRGTEVDFEDCLMLVKRQKNSIDIKQIDRHFRKLASYDISEKRIIAHIEHFLNLLQEEGLHG